MSIGTIYRRGIAPNVRFQFATQNHAATTNLSIRTMTSDMQNYGGITAFDNRLYLYNGSAGGMDVLFQSNLAVNFTKSSMNFTPTAEVAVDNEFVYGINFTGTNDVLTKFYRNNFDVENTYNLNAAGKFIYIDDDYLYTLNSAGIYKYHKHNMAFITNSPVVPINIAHPQKARTPFSFTNNFIYTADGTQVTRVHRDNLTIANQVTISNVTATLNTVYAEEDFVYLKDNSNLYKLHASNLVTSQILRNIGHPTQTSYEYRFILGDKNYLYTTNAGKFILKISKATLEPVRTFPLQGVVVNYVFDVIQNAVITEDKWIYFSKHSSSASNQRLKSIRKFTVINDSIGKARFNDFIYIKEVYK